MWDVEALRNLPRVSPLLIGTTAGDSTLSIFILSPKEPQWLYFGGHWVYTHRQNVSFSTRQVVEKALDHESVQGQASS